MLPTFRPHSNHLPTSLLAYVHQALTNSTSRPQSCYGDPLRFRGKFHQPVTVWDRYRMQQLRYYAANLKTLKTGERLDDKVVLAAREVLGRGASQSLSEIDKARKVKELEGLKDALSKWELQKETHASLQSISKNDPDPDLRSLAELDLESSEEELSSRLSRLKSHLLSQSQSSSTSTSSATSLSELGAILEVKSGVGGSESSLFAGELVRMYLRLCARRGLKAEVVEATMMGSVSTGSTLSGGGSGAALPYREAIVEVDGKGAYGKLRNESGVHRVQRVPATESSGRVHTSTVSVIVLPMIDESSSSVVDVLDEKEVKVEFMRSRGAGGQHVNKTESACKLTHLPTGITVSMQDSRSQHQNRTKAFRILRARVLDRKMALEAEQKRRERKSLVKGKDRSEKVRTYNFAQDRCTDHRIPLTLTGLDEVLDGEEQLDVFCDELERIEEEEVVDAIIAGEN